MSASATDPPLVTPRPPVPAPATAAGSGGDLAEVGLALALGGGLLALVFLTAGGVDQTSASGASTWSEIVVTLLGAGLCAGVLVQRRRAPRWGAVTAGLLALLTAWRAASIAWSVLPDSSWLAVDQALSYLAAFAGAAALARMAPRRTSAVVTAIALAMAAACVWALVLKVFPSALSATRGLPAADQYGRLQDPFGYWNALGLGAALGLVCCLWVGTRRGAPRLLVGAVCVAIAAFVSVLVLSYSRSADLAAVVGVVLWLAAMPSRLRAAALLLVGGIAGAVVSAWALTHHALTDDKVAIAAQDHAGHTFGIVVAVVLVLAFAAGVAFAAAADRRTLAAGTWRRLTLAMAAVVPLAVAVAVVGLALSSRGLGGQISHAWSQLTSSSTTTGNEAGRVLQFGSSRPVYWHEAITVGDHNVLRGAGEAGFAAARLRYTTDTSFVHQAHSYVFQTYADLGVVGLLMTAALLAAWLGCAARAIDPRARWRALTPAVATERGALLTLAVTVVAFGVHSTLDYTWYFPGVALPALLAAGWLAGRGPLLRPPPAAVASPRGPGAPLIARPAAVGAALILVVLALAGAWLQWRPLRSAQQVDAAIGASSTAQRYADARSALHADPLSLQPRQLLSTLYLGDHRVTDARAQLRRAVDSQPENPAAWDLLGGFELRAHEWPAAIDAYRHVLALYGPPDAVRARAVQSIQRAQVMLAGIAQGK